MGAFPEMSPVSLAKLGDIASLGLFKSCRSADMPRFRQYNLVYGFNGSGKTTLSRVLHSLGSGARCTRLPEEGAFSVHLTDGSVIRSDGDLSALAGRVVVFNSDFIDDSFLWSKGEARPVFYIGKEQRELAGSLEEKTSESVAASREQVEASESEAAATRAFQLFKRNVARTIADQLSLGRRYDAASLSADYSSAQGAFAERRTTEQIEHFRAVISQQAAAPKIVSLSGFGERVSSLAERLATVFQTTLGKLALENLRGHDGMRTWLMTGLRYHEAKALRECLLCGHEFDDARRGDLSAMINGAYEHLQRELDACAAEVGSIESYLRTLIAEMPRPAEFVTARREYVTGIRARIGSLSNEALRGVQKLSELIQKKSGAPHELQMGSEWARELEVLTDTMHSIEGALEEFNATIAEHNDGVDRFEESQNEAAAAIKDHLLAEAEQEYRELEAAVGAAVTRRGEADARAVALESEVQRLKGALRAHGPAADVVNRLIHNYLGRTDLSLVTAEDGYRLRRNGRLVRGSLSEGEKTAIAICYFITTLGAEGRNKRELIVVIDDPVSSLDSRALNYSFNVLRAILEDVCQVVLLTHNLHYMNQICNWLKPRTESALKRNGKNPDDATAALLFLDVVLPTDATSRACTLTALPKYIRDYESEYHYLVHLLLGFVESKGANDYVYLMPNAMRKVLDVFLAFRLPGADGLGSKVSKAVAIAAERSVDIDPARVFSLVTLAQVESHSDNLDDLVTLSAPTLEEIRTAAETLLQLMHALDEPHLAEMRRLCS